MSYSIRDILDIEVAPALGCTEPVAIALAAAAAASLIGDNTVETIEVWLDPNVYKNGLAVAIPGTEGLSGLDMAAALGALGGNPQRGLEVLEDMDADVVARARAYLEEGRVTVNLLKEHKGLYVKSVVSGGGDTAEALIQDMHDNIVSLSLNGQSVSSSPLLKTGGGGDKGGLKPLEDWLRDRSLAELFNLIDTLDQEDLVFLKKGLDLNMRLAEHGLKHGSGLGVGMALERLTIQKVLRKDMVLAAKILTSAAADARMSGVKLPAMTSAGSGNHGLTAILPIKAVSDYVETSETTLLKAIAFSHIITAYIKAHTGRLTALCGCSIAAGAGAAAGVTFLMGGSLHHIAGAIKNISVDLAGVICDGAKAGCAFKLSTAAGSAVQAALFALQGIAVLPTDGIVGLSPEDTMRNIGELATRGMVEADRTILQIMLDKQFSEF
jgi:L-cysteine desulfidase